jgi:predicted DNA-binding ribbon-helix-helix protein
MATPISSLIEQLDLGRPKKRSLTLRGHRTSVSLEDAFWQAFVTIAQDENIPINALAADIDAVRLTETSLASAIRLFVLKWYQPRVL